MDERNDRVWWVAIPVAAVGLIAAIYFFWPQAPWPAAQPPRAAGPRQR